MALQLENRPEFPLHFLALNSLGVSVVPLNPDYRAAELEYVLAHSEAPRLVNAQTLEDPPPTRKRGRRRASAPCSTPPAPPASRKAACSATSISSTSAERYLDEGGLCAVRHGEERLITPLPFFHMNALAVSTTAMILSAGCVVQLDRFHPKTWWRDVVDSGATIVHYLGVMPAILMNLPETPEQPSRPLRLRREREP